MNFPIISIAIPTFNSAKTLSKTLNSIKKQRYPQNRIEILIIDGGSTDSTIKIAKRYKCKIIPNPKIDLIYGKHIGFLKAKGKYLMYLDSDEILENNSSLEIKYQSFKKNDQIKAVMPSGYRTPTESSSINYYINEFGDPFSFFIFRESKGVDYLIKDFKKKYKKVSEDKNCVLFSFLNTAPLPLVEFWAGGCMIDLEYIKNKFPEIKNDPATLAQLFYLLNIQKKFIAITKNDSTIHYSSPNLQKYLKKIAARVRNNVYQTDMGKGGFLGREKFQPSFFSLKKYLFVPYSLSIIFPTIDAIYLTLTRKKLVYLLHLPLCVYTSLLIIYYLSLKQLHVGIKIKHYGS